MTMLVKIYDHIFALYIKNKAFDYRLVHQTKLVYDKKIGKMKGSSLNSRSHCQATARRSHISSLYLLIQGMEATIRELLQKTTSS